MKSTLICILILAGATQASGQVIQPAADVVRTPRDRGSHPTEYEVGETQTFFIAGDPVHGRELWRSDGTADGTRLVADFCPGGCSTAIRLLATSGDLLYFAMDGGLWKTDGTDAGTSFISRPAEDFQPFYHGEGVVLDDKLLFIVNDADFRRFLWTSDGTAEGTRSLGVDFEATVGRIDLTVVGDRVFFFTNEYAGDVELWSSDGTPEGTEPITTVCVDCHNVPTHLTPLGDRLFFAADDGVHGREPWISDGTAEGTRMLADLNPGNLGSNTLAVAVLGDQLYGLVGSQCSRGGCFFRSDGTPEGTAYVPELYPPTLGRPIQVATAGSTLYLNVRDAMDELWAIGGLGGPARLGTHGSIHLFGEAQGSLLYRTFGTSGALRATDGTAATTRLLADDVNVSLVAAADDRTLLTTQRFVDGDYTEPEPWVTDGTTAGTQLLRDLHPPTSDSDPEQMTAWGDTVAWVGKQDGTQLFAVWQLADSAAVPLAEDLYPHPMAVAQDRLYAGTFRAGTTEGPGLLLFEPDGSSRTIVVDRSPSEMVPFGNRLLFGTDAPGQALWSTDGTQDGTDMILDVFPLWGGPCQILCPGPYPEPAPNHLTPLGDRMLFVAFESEDGPGQLWSTDGSAEGSRVLREFQLAPELGIYPAFDSPSDLTRVGDLVYFTAYDRPTGREVWRTDGTAEGTRIVAEVTPDGSGAEPTLLTAWQPLTGPPSVSSPNAVWVVRDEDGDKLLRSSTAGPPSATLIVDFGDPDIGGPGSRVHELVASGDLLYLAVTTPAAGRELWVSDGFLQGTRLIDLRTDNPRGSGVAHLTPIPGGIYFAAAGSAGDGFEPWISNGTSVGTTLISDLNPGPSASDPGPGTLVRTELGDRLYFAADNGEIGRELFVLELSSPTETCPVDRLCLQQGRFEITMGWHTAGGASGTARRIGSTEDSGLLWFFEPNNWEAMVKVLDGCGINEHFWVFAATSTDVGYTLTVEDLWTGERKTYTNPVGESAAAITDTEALAVCP